LFEIDSAIGTPVTLDVASPNRVFGHYAQILIDMDLPRNIFDEIMVEREGYAFYVNVTYELMPDSCSHCAVIKHFVTNCRWLQTHKKSKNQNRKKRAQGSKAAKVTKANKANVYSKSK